MQVLIYKCNDYIITIKTSDIVAAWNRFNSRVPESSRTYCTYASTHEADDLQLLKVADDGKTTAMENIGGGKEWEGQPPVLFETEIYHFFISSSALATVWGMVLRKGFASILNSVTRGTPNCSATSWYLRRST